MRGFTVRTDSCQRSTKLFGAVQAFGHYSFAESTFLVIGMCADRFEDRGTGYIVEPDSAELGKFTIIGNGWRKVLFVMPNGEKILFSAYSENGMPEIRSTI